MSSAVERSLMCRVVLGCAAGLGADCLLVGCQAVAWSLLALGLLLASAVAVVGIYSWYADVPPCGAPGEDEEESERISRVGAQKAVLMDGVAESRSDFVGYCELCGRPLFAHDAKPVWGGFGHVHAECGSINADGRRHFEEVNE